MREISISEFKSALMMTGVGFLGRTENSMGGISSKATCSADLGRP